MRRRSVTMAVTLFLPLAAAEAHANGVDGGNTGFVSDHAGDERPRPASSGSGLECDQLLLTQSVVQAVFPSNSVSCNASGNHTDNSYYRVFEGIPPLSVCSVEIGVEAAQGQGGGQPIEVRIYDSGTAELLAGTFGPPIGETATLVPDQELSHLTIPVFGETLTGTLTVEIFTPNGQAEGNSFFIGSNDVGQTAPGYIAAVSCGIPLPVDIASIGFPNMHIVMNVAGSPLAGCPADLTGPGPGDPPDGVVNIFDLLALLANFGRVALLGDITGPDPGDLPDGVVNVFDLLLLLGNFGTAGPEGDITGPSPGDPPEGMVNVFDLLALLANFGETAPETLLGDITGPSPGDPPDGTVNVFDLLDLLAVFGQTCPTAS